MTFDNGDVVDDGPTKVNKNTSTSSSGRTAHSRMPTTNLPGRLVLSDFSCEGDGKNPPPKK